MDISKLVQSADEKLSVLKQKRIIIVANLQTKSNKHKFSVVDANVIEKFTDNEFKEIIEALDFLQLNYQVYFCELDFINNILKNKTELNNIIVLNFARNGIKEGKKSLIPAFCDLLGIMYTSSNAAVQSLCRNKFVYNKYLKQLGVKVPDTYVLYPTKRWLNDAPPKWRNEKTIVKPIAESGSIGILSEILRFKDIDISKISFVNNQAMLFQEYIEGVEVECAFFMHNEETIVLPPIQLNTNSCILDEKTSMSNNYSFKRYESPVTNTILSLVKLIVQALGITNYGRIDFRINDKNEVFLFDVATMPYICNHSSVVFAMESQGYSKSDIYKIILTERIV